MVIFLKITVEIHGRSEWVERLGFLHPLPIPGLGEGTMHMKGRVFLE